MISLHYTSHTKAYNTIYTACNIVEAIYSFTVIGTHFHTCLRNLCGIDSILCADVALRNYWYLLIDVVIVNMLSCLACD